MFRYRYYRSLIKVVQVYIWKVCALKTVDHREWFLNKFIRHSVALLCFYYTRTHALLYILFFMFRVAVIKVVFFSSFAFFLELWSSTVSSRIICYYLISSIHWIIEKKNNKKVQFTYFLKEINILLFIHLTVLQTILHTINWVVCTHCWTFQ